MASWDDRVLCPDENCIGVIGPDGACKVCGRVAPNAPAKAVAADAASDGEDADDEDGDYDDDEDEDADVESGVAVTARRAPDAAAASAGAADDWDNRILCPDGACTGVITGGGKCSVCGRTAAEINA